MSHIGSSEFLFSKGADPTELAQSDGDVISYNSKMPDVFENPLTISNNGIMYGVKSGERSVLLNHQDTWYKIKGACPTDKVYQIEDNPVGGQKKSASIAELNATKILYEFGKKNGIESSLEPVCLFDYGIPFQGETVCGSVFKTRGDLRLIGFLYNEFRSLLENLYDNGHRDTDVIYNIRENITNRIGGWLGFWYSALEESDVCWGTVYQNEYPFNKVFDTNAGIHNISIYSVENGIGMSMVDLDRSAKTNDKIKAYELDKIRVALEVFDGALYFLENGKCKESILHWIVHMNGKCIHRDLEVFANPNETFKIPLPREFEIINHFEDGRNGKKPKPIDDVYIRGPIEEAIDMLT